MKKVSPVFQDGMKALSDSPIVGEVRRLLCANVGRDALELLVNVLVCA